MDTYTLLLQPARANEPFDAEAVEAALEARGVRRGPDGRLTWTFGVATVGVKRVREGAATVAVELLVPLDERPQLVRRVLEQALLVAAASGVRVIDPHLARAVDASDANDVEASFQSAARYVAGIEGRAVAPHVSAGPLFGGTAAPSSFVLRGGALLWIAIAVFLFALWLGSKLTGVLR